MGRDHSVSPLSGIFDFELTCTIRQAPSSVIPSACSNDCMNRKKGRLNGSCYMAKRVLSKYMHIVKHLNLDSRWLPAHFIATAQQICNATRVSDSGSHDPLVKLYL